MADIIINDYSDSRMKTKLLDFGVIDKDRLGNYTSKSQIYDDVDINKSERDLYLKAWDRKELQIYSSVSDINVDNNLTKAEKIILGYEYTISQGAHSAIPDFRTEISCKCNVIQIINSRTPNNDELMAGINGDKRYNGFILQQIYFHFYYEITGLNSISSKIIEQLNDVKALDELFPDKHPNTSIEFTKLKRGLVHDFEVHLQLNYLESTEEFSLQNRNIKLKRILRDILSGKIDKYESKSEWYKKNVEAKFDDEWEIFIKELPPEHLVEMDEEYNRIIYEYEEYRWGCKQQRLRPVSFLEYLRSYY